MKAEYDRGVRFKIAARLRAAPAGKTKSPRARLALVTNEVIPERKFTAMSWYPRARRSSKQVLCPWPHQFQCRAFVLVIRKRRTRAGNRRLGDDEAAASSFAAATW
jgi:hypothetical protein